MHKGLRAADGETVAKTLNSRFAIVDPKVVEVNETFSYDVSIGLDKGRSYSQNPRQAPLTSAAQKRDREVVITCPLADEATKGLTKGPGVRIPHHRGSKG